MFSRVLGAIAVLSAALVLPACFTGGDTTAQEPLEPDPVVEPDWDQGEIAGPGAPAEPSVEVAQPTPPAAPPAWTGAFSKTAVVLSNTLTIEGPAGVRDHIVASSDDVYERTLESTAEGLTQIIRRTSADTGLIRVQVDAWSFAAYDRVVIVEREDDCPVRIVASGEAMWRDPNGGLYQGNRLEFTGELGDDTPYAPPSSPNDATDAAENASDDSTETPSDDSSADSNEAASNG